MIKLKVSEIYWNFYFLLSKCLVLSHLNWAVWSLKPGVNLIFFRSILTSWATPNFPKNSVAFFSCPNSSINPSPIFSWIKLASWNQCRLNMIKPLVIYINFWRLDDPPRIDEEILCARELDLDYQTFGISTVKKSLDLDITDHYNKRTMHWEMWLHFSFKIAPFSNLDSVSPMQLFASSGTFTKMLLAISSPSGTVPSQPQGSFSMRARHVSSRWINHSELR